MVCGEESRGEEEKTYKKKSFLQRIYGDGKGGGRWRVEATTHVPNLTAVDGGVVAADAEQQQTYNLETLIPP